jgi:hypothetical protein
VRAAVLRGCKAVQHAPCDVLAQLRATHVAVGCAGCACECGRLSRLRREGALRAECRMRAGRRFPGLASQSETPGTGKWPVSPQARRFRIEHF